DAVGPRLRQLREVRPRLPGPRGARGDGERPEAREGHVRLERRGRRARRRDDVQAGRPREVHRPPALELLDVASRQGAARRHDGRRLDVLRLQRERELDALPRLHRRRAQRAGHRGGARLGRGGRRIAQARRRAPRADRDPRDRRSRAVRGGRARVVPAALVAVELVGLYWTVSGPVEVHVGREWSLFGWDERCAAAREVGFSGLGIWHADLEHLLETQSLGDLKRVFDDNGLRHLELEFLMDWFLDPGDERRVESDRMRRLLFEAAVAFGAHHIKVGNIPGAPAELPHLTERYAELCSDAAAHTDARVVYEFMPFDANVRSLDAALAVVT